MTKEIISNLTTFLVSEIYIRLWQHIKAPYNVLFMTKKTIYIRIISRTLKNLTGINQDKISKYLLRNY